jgi:hypothetical protein
MVESYLRNWVLEWRFGSSYSRMMTASLWVCHHESFENSINYLIQLQKAGFCHEPKSVYWAIRDLMKARTLVENDGDVAPLLLGGVLPKDPLDWVPIEICKPDAELSPTHPVYLGACDNLLDICLQEIEQYREASCYDEWLLRGWHLATLGHQCKQWMSEVLEGLNPTMTAVWDGIEEVVCDAGSSTALAAYKARDGYPFVSDFDSTAGLGIIQFQSISPGDWEERLVNERGVIPCAIRDELYRSAGSGVPLGTGLPRRWAGLSNTLVAPYYHVLRKDDCCPHLQINPPTLEQLQLRGPYEDVVDFFVDDLRDKLGRATACMESLDWDGAVAILAPASEEYPWSYLIHHELAIAYDSSGRHDQAHHHIQEAIVVDPIQEGFWQSLAVILKHLGRGREAVIAHMVRTTLAKDRTAQ